jgi:serine/threonine protein phosphatase 1
MWRLKKRNKKVFQKFDYNGGRTFVVGDIHGCFQLLEDSLSDHNFDKSVDHLFSVGDLVDRGPASHLALDYLNQPWFHAVRGNHEQMVIDAGGTSWHVNNGGQWFNDLDAGQQLMFVAAFDKLPTIIQFTSPSGRRIGIVHAAYLRDTWDNIEQTIENSVDRLTTPNPLLWDRNLIRSTGFGGLEPVKGIDHIYCGHTPTKAPITSGNISWIDTGAFATNKLTVIEVD